MNAEINGLINKINSCIIFSRSILNRKRYTIYVFKPNNKVATTYKGTFIRLTFILNPPKSTLLTVHLYVTSFMPVTALKNNVLQYITKRSIKKFHIIKILHFP